jgi:flagellar biosynthesis/type III secretory pathway M-ring protein FliF/YscJ
MIAATHALSTWQRLSTRMRATIAAASIAALGCLAATLALTHDDRVALFSSPLHSDQLSEVETRLAAWNVAFVPTSDNVRVDRRRRSDLLLRLSLSGLPHPHVASSTEALANVGALTPEAVLDAQTRDGLAGDLELGLRGVAGIADARVIIAPAKAGIYADEAAHDASASVRLTLLPGAHLSPDAIAGIRAFVAAGVPGLEPSRVTILDDSGVALSSDDRDGTHEGEGLQTALQSALDDAFGNGTSIVRVHIDLDPRARETSDVRRLPLGGPITTASVDERFASSQKHYSKTASNEDRGSDVHEERSRVGPGATERVSVAIFVDAARADDVPKIRALAIGAAGLRFSRGDSITVEAIRFASVQAPPGLRWPSVIGLVATIAPSAIFGVVVVLFARLALGPCANLLGAWLERRAVRATADSVCGYAPSAVRGALAGEPPHAAAAIISALPTATAAAVLELYPPEERSDIVRRLARTTSPLVPDYQAWLSAARTTHG